VSALTPATVAQLARAVVGVADQEWLTSYSRATLHRHARAAGLALPPRRTRTPTREEWKSLMVEHGLNITSLATATGLRRDYVRNLLLTHGLITSWTGRRNGRWAEWTEEA
jgi:hypothetical protein